MIWLERIKSAIGRILPQQSFVRSVSVLAGGTAAAQAIGVIALPAVTRLYTPADFAVLAVYSSILGIVAVVACLRLDIAIPLPKSDDDGANLLAMSLLCSTAFTVICALVIWWFAEQIVKAVGQPGLQPFLWMLPLGIWLSSTYSSVQFWATRKKRFAAIAKTRVTQTAGSLAAQFGFGLLGAGPFGLLLGQLITSGAGVFGLGRTAWNVDKHAFRQVTWLSMLRVLREHDRFPKYSTFEAFANNAAIQFPVLIIAAVTAGPEAGHLFLAMRAMAIPMGLIGGAIAQVYLARASDELRSGQLPVFTLNIVAGLMRVGVGPLLCAGIVAPFVFPLVFGAPWHRAGEMVAWMTPWFVMQLLVSPVSMSLHVTNHQHTALGLQLFGLALRVGATGIAATFSVGQIFEFYAISGFIFYSLYFAVVARVTCIKSSELWRTFKLQLWIIVAWTGLGCIVAIGIVLLS